MAKQFGKLRGVYFIFEKDELTYVGETGSFNGRMEDLSKSNNHKLMRSIDEKLFSNQESYKKKCQAFIHSSHWEKIDDYMEANLSVSCLPLEIGRE